MPALDSSTGPTPTLLISGEPPQDIGGTRLTEGSPEHSCASEEPWGSRVPILASVESTEGTAQGGFWGRGELSQWIGRGSAAGLPWTSHGERLLHAPLPSSRT